MATTALERNTLFLPGIDQVAGCVGDRPRLAVAADPVRALSRVRPLRALHGELSDLYRDVRRERQPARPDLPDARGRRRSAGDGAGCARAPRALPRLPGVRVGMSLGRSVRQDDRALQDRAPELGDRQPKDQLARAADSPSPVSLSGSGEVGSGAGPAACSGWGSSTGPNGRAFSACCRRPCGACRRCLPKLSGPRGRLPEVLPAIGPKRRGLPCFLGCVADAMFPETNAATARVLQENGCEVVIPRTQVVLWRNRLPLGSRGAGARSRPTQHRLPSTRPASTRSSSTPPAVARCSKTTPTFCPLHCTTKRRDSSSRSRISPSS